MALATPVRYANLHDVELCALSAAGDRRAFEELVRRHGTAVRALLRRMGADGSTADDVGQDAFIAAFEQIAEFRGEGTFTAWVRKIAARLYLRRIRKDRRLVALVADEAEPAPETGPGADGKIDLDRALNTLSAVERICVSLCYGAGVSHVEAAEALNLPLGTVKSHVKRGLDKLRARLDPDSASSEARRGNG
ncbi:RNA polymerase sigma factor [Phenylobacterium immobile]|uniref:RNA polymerase sigma factor n=1 Tax=Phenylobacterium immobile TaxID=21 RepID=UPI000A6AB2A2|nr:RNA polymerase sigma factor [Phenylobacterium immobile]